MDAEKRQRYEKIAAEIVRLAGGLDNILGVAHCATRLRLVLEDNDQADTGSIENVDLVKGVFVAGDQLQIIFGAGLLNDVCQVLAESIHMDSMSLGDLKSKANKADEPPSKGGKGVARRVYRDYAGYPGRGPAYGTVQRSGKSEIRGEQRHPLRHFHPD